MSKKIAMRMNAEQFESIKGILEENNIGVMYYEEDYDYTFVDEENDINCFRKASDWVNDFKLHEEFNAKTFLNSLGIEYNEPQPTESIERYNIFDKAQQLIKDAKNQGIEIEIKEGVIILKQVIK